MMAHATSELASSRFSMLMFVYALARPARPLMVRPALPGVLACAAARGAGNWHAPADSSVSVALPSAAQTLALGARIASVACAGDVVLLDGSYGMGKTCLARGFVREWCADPDEPVTSPSYLIDNVYSDDEGRGRVPGVAVHHIDLWRLPEGKVGALVDLPHIFTECVSLIEWPERLTASQLPAEYLAVRLSVLGDDDGVDGGGDGGGGGLERSAECEELDDQQPRMALLTAVGPRWAERLQQLQG